MSGYHLIIFAKAPQAGLAKTRLIPALGAEGAAKLAEKLLLHTIEQALLTDADTVELCVTPAPSDPAWARLKLPERLTLTEQASGDLGNRLAQACQRAFKSHQRVLLIGSDCPSLDANMLRRAAEALLRFDAVVIPAMDGGYTLLGLTNFSPSLFIDMPWSTSTVAYETLIRLSQQQQLTMQFDALADIDEPGDLKYLPPFWSEAKSYTNGEHIDSCR